MSLNCCFHLLLAWRVRSSILQLLNTFTISCIGLLLNPNNIHPLLATFHFIYLWPRTCASRLCQNTHQILLLLHLLLLFLGTELYLVLSTSISILLSLFLFILCTPLLAFPPPLASLPSLGLNQQQTNFLLQYHNNHLCYNVWLVWEYTSSSSSFCFILDAFRSFTTQNFN